MTIRTKERDSFANSSDSIHRVPWLSVWDDPDRLPLQRGRVRAFHLYFPASQPGDPGVPAGVCAAGAVEAQFAKLQEVYKVGEIIFKGQ